MKTDNIALVITVQKLNKTFVCTDQFGTDYKTDKDDAENGIPEWRYRKAHKGNFKLIKKYDKNGVIHWKRYKSDKDGEIITNKTESEVAETSTVQTNVN